MSYASFFLPTGDAWLADGKEVLSGSNVKDMCKNQIDCLSSMKYLWQLDYWAHTKLYRVGSVVQYFSETALKGSFHPATIHEENELIVSQRKEEIQL